MTVEDDDGERVTAPGPAPCPAPCPASGGGARDGRPLREIAVGMFGAERVDAEWHPDGWMRTMVRRRLRRSRLAAETDRGDPGTGGAGRKRNGNTG